MHRMKSKLLATIMATIMIFATLGTAFAATDTAGHWASDTLNNWSSKGLISGYPDGTMKPNAPVTRAEFVTFVNRTLKGKDANATCSFTDVKKTDWFYADVATAYAAGYIMGYEDGSFKPSSPISRQEAAVIVGRVIDGIGTPDLTILAQFNDASKIAAWAKPSVASLVAKGLLKGYADGTFGAEKQITRAESVVVLDRGIVSAPVVVQPAPVISSGGGGWSPLVVSVYANPTMSVAVGGTSQISVTATPADAVIGYVSNNSSIASVSSTGLVTGVVAGTTTITVAGSKSGYSAGSCTVTVTVGGAAGTVAVTATPATMSVAVGAGAQITASANPADATISYSSSNPAVASVSGTGVVTGVAAGTATITVTGAKTGYSNGSATVAVTVTPAAGTTAAVTLADTASGIGKVATVTVSGFTGATQYKLLKTDDTALTGNVALGQTVVVMFVNVGDQVKVQVMDAAGAVLETKTVTTTATIAETGTAAVSLANTASGIGKVATVTLTGYTTATQYKLLKAADDAALTGNVAAGQTVVVMFLNVGDQVKVQVMNSTGGTIETKTVTTTATQTGPAETGTAAVSLANTASGIGKVATVTLTGYTTATQYKLLKAADDAALTGNVAAGSTVVVMFLNVGDQVKVQVMKADGTIIETKTVTTTGAAAPPAETGTAAVSLGNTASGIGKVATVTLTGYTTATQYKLLKAADDAALTGNVAAGSTVVVMFLNVGDQVKVQVMKADGTVIETKTVTTTATPVAPAETGTAAVALGNTASGIGKLATVTLTGYTTATQYKLLKADDTALTGNVAAGSTVVVMFLNVGDTCKVQVMKADGTIIETKTVTTTAN